MTANSTYAQETLMRHRAVTQKTGVSKSTIYYFIARNEFPKPVKIGRRAVAWRASDIEAWIGSRQQAA